jgi:hypothetical protein
MTPASNKKFQSLLCLTASKSVDHLLFFQIASVSAFYLAVGHLYDCRLKVIKIIAVANWSFCLLLPR